MTKLLGVVAVASLCAVGCAHAPTTAGGRAELTSAARRSVDDMVARDPGLRSRLDQAAGYVVFPNVGEGGFLVGGGAGVGVVFEHGRVTGYAELRHASAGALFGGQSYSELIVVNDRRKLDAMRSGDFDFGVKAQAVIVGTGASANADFSRGMAVFVHPLRGAMVNASLTGQRVRVF